MKFYLSLLLLFFTFNASAQITFLEVLDFEGMTYKDVQSALFKEYNIISDQREYKYQPLRQCDPPSFHEDNCSWSCTIPDYLQTLKSKYPLSKIKFKHASNKYYQMQLCLKSTFAEHYNISTKTATTFININETKCWENSNCRNEMVESAWSIPLNVAIQFADPDHWNSFKRSVLDYSEFYKTNQTAADSPIEFIYGIKRELKNGVWKGIRIVLYEKELTYHASLFFNCSLQ